MMDTTELDKLLYENSIRSFAEESNRIERILDMDRHETHYKALRSLLEAETLTVAS